MMFSTVSPPMMNVADVRSPNPSFYLPHLVVLNGSMLTDELSIGLSLAMARLPLSRVKTTVRTTSWTLLSERSLQ